MGSQKGIYNQNEQQVDKILQTYELKLAEIKDGEDLPKPAAKKIEALHEFSQKLRDETSQLTQSCKMLNQLVDAAQVPILLLDADLKILRYTPSVATIFDQVELKTGVLLSEVLRHSTFERLNKQIQKFFQNQKSQEVEFYLKKSKEWYLTNILPFPTKRNITGVIITFLNITKDKEYEKKLNKLNQTLELEIQQQNQQVKKLAAELMVAEQKERKRIARLLHNDLQQQLFSTQTKAELLGEDVPAEFQERAQEIAEQISHSLKLTQQLVVSLSPPDIENNDLYEGLNWLCNYIYNFHGLFVSINEVSHIELENQDILVLVLQMIQELLFNIVKHAGVKKAKITTEESGAMIHIHVIDKGIGFEKKDNDLAGSFGLSQTREQLELIGGKLTINSIPGDGTDMCLSLPRHHYIRTLG